MRFHTTRIKTINQFKKNWTCSCTKDRLLHVVHLSIKLKYCQIAGQWTYVYLAEIPTQTRQTITNWKCRKRRIVSLWSLCNIWKTTHPFLAVMLCEHCACANKSEATSNQQICQILFRPCTFQHSGKPFKNMKEKPVYPSQLPQKIHQNNITQLLWWGLTSLYVQNQKWKMMILKNYGYTKVSPSKPNGGAVCQSCHPVNQSVFFLILWGNSASGPYWQCCPFMWYHFTHWGIYIIISVFIHCGLEITPLCFTWCAAWILYRSHVPNES